MAGVYIGIDIGATFLRAGLFTGDGRLVRKIKREFPREGFSEALKSLVIDIAGGRVDSVVAVGVGSIGPLDLLRGSVVNTPNAPIKNFEIARPIRELGLKVILANDAAASAWGEYVLGLGRGFDNILYITISTGLGGGVIVDGNLLVGKDGNAHEIGHIVVDYSSRVRCGCGGIGHWEGIASGANIPRSFAEYVKERGLCGDIGSWLCEELSAGRYPKPEDIFKHYYIGDPVASKYIDDYLMVINAAGIASAINVYDPEILILGGSVALNNREVFIRGIGRYLDKYLTVRRPKIVFTGFEDNVGIYGAAALAIRTPSTLAKYAEIWNKNG
jgi:glucokinase